jgi:hypothetical protein
VGSRAWENSKRISLIPFADFMNHDGLSASIVLRDEDNQLSEVYFHSCYLIFCVLFVKGLCTST